MSNTKKKIAKINASEVFIKEDSLPEYLLKLNLDKLINIPGTVKMFAGNDIPDGWLLCDGSEVNRETYVDLFNAIGTTWGEGDGSTTFNLPNCVGRFAEGATTSGSYKSAGLPNITGYITNLPVIVSTVQTGVFAGSQMSNGQDGSNVAYQAYGTGYFYSLRVNAAICNAIYGNSSTVQPPSFTTRYIIKY